MERMILTASDGMVYTDGTFGGKVVYLAKGLGAEGWYEIPEETFVQMLECGEATAGDYQEALREFGVDV